MRHDDDECTKKWAGALARKRYAPRVDHEQLLGLRERDSLYKLRCLYTEFSIETPWFVHRMVERWESSRNFFFSLRNLASTFSLVFVVFLQPPSERASVKYILFYAQISFLERLYIASSISSATIFRCMALSDDVILNPATIAEGSSSRGGTLSSGGVISPF